MSTHNNDNQQQFEEHLARALEGDKEAQYWVGHCYYLGKGVERDWNEATYWFQRAATKRWYHQEGAISGKALYQLGRCSEIKRSRALWHKAVPLMIKEAEQRDDVESMFLLGRVFSFGQGVEPDPKRAFQWYHRAARKGHVSAQCELADCCRNGLGTRKDFVRALSWARKAAAADSGSSDNDNSKQYLSGLLNEIVKKRSRLTKLVRQSLTRSRDGNLGTWWCFGIAKLTQQQKPIGLSPLFEAIVTLAPKMSRQCHSAASETG